MTNSDWRFINSVSFQGVALKKKESEITQRGISSLYDISSQGN
jgi:hypothetical protein